MFAEWVVWQCWGVNGGSGDTVAKSVGEASEQPKEDAVIRILGSSLSDH